MNEFEQRMRCRARSLIEYYDNVLAYHLPMREPPDPEEDALDRLGFADARSDARRALESLDDPEGELRQCFDRGEPITENWLSMLMLDNEQS